MKTLYCTICGTVFASDRTNRLYCTARCRRKAAKFAEKSRDKGIATVVQEEVDTRWFKSLVNPTLEELQALAKVYSTMESAGLKEERPTLVLGKLPDGWDMVSTLAITQMMGEKPQWHVESVREDAVDWSKIDFSKISLK